MTFVQTEQLINAFKEGETDFHKVVITKAVLAGTFLPFVNLEEAYLHQADFRHAVLPGAQLRRAYLVETNFEHANLLGVDLGLANLNQSRLDYALLASANLERVILRGSSLIGARLANANLAFADLRNVNLTGANLQGANLSKANLFGSRVTPNTLDNATFSSTIMPSGQCYSGSWKNYDRTSVSSLDIPEVSNTWIDEPPIEKTDGTDLPNNHKPEPASGLLQTTLAATLKGDQPSQQKIIGFRLSETSADLSLEILDHLTTQDKENFICINHFL